MGGGSWKTNCSYTLRLWVLQASETGEKVIFSYKLVAGSLILALQFQKTQQAVVTLRHAALGCGQPGREQRKPTQQPGRCPVTAAAPVTMIAEGS